MKRFFGIIAASYLMSTAAFATPPDEQLSDPALEAKAREISKNLRCLVCQNQSIDDSDAELAKDLRRIVRERLKAGDDTAAINNYVVDRYGEYVLLKPRLNASTFVLWGSPLIFVLIGFGFAAYTLRRKTPEKEHKETPPISLKDKDILDNLRDN